MHESCKATNAKERAGFSIHVQMKKLGMERVIVVIDSTFSASVLCNRKVQKCEVR